VEKEDLRRNQVTEIYMEKRSSVVVVVAAAAAAEV